LLLSDLLLFRVVDMRIALYYVRTAEHSCSAVIELPDTPDMMAGVENGEITMSYLPDDLLEVIDEITGQIDTLGISEAWDETKAEEWRDRLSPNWRAGRTWLIA
jgi:hypothetical protein